MQNNNDINKMDHDLIGKNHKEIEKKYGFIYYLETKDEMILGEKVSSKSLVTAFLEFNKERPLRVVKLYDGTIQDINTIKLTDIKSNLLLLSEKRGIFYDDSDNELATSFGFLCEDYFAEIMEGIIFFSGKEDSVYSFSEVLDKFNIKYHEPYNLGQENIVNLRKLGRNQPCHCGSGLKYKKCCLEKDIKETGKPKKVKTTYF